MRQVSERDHVRRHGHRRRRRVHREAERWGDEDSRTVADILHAEQQGPEHTTQIGSAIEWLRDFLHGPDDDFTHEPVESSAVKEAGKKEGYSADVIKRAAKRLNVDITNTSTVPRRTLWALPDKAE